MGLSNVCLVSFRARKDIPAMDIEEFDVNKLILSFLGAKCLCCMNCDQ